MYSLLHHYQFTLRNWHIPSPLLRVCLEKGYKIDKIEGFAILIYNVTFLIFICFLNILIPLLYTDLRVADLLQRLRSRERERQRLTRPRSRDNRKSLSSDAPPFYMPTDGGGGGSVENSLTVEQQPGAPPSSTADMTIQRRQLGERLYPKIHNIQPVCHSFLFSAMI